MDLTNPKKHRLQHSNSSSPSFTNSIIFANSSGVLNSTNNSQPKYAYSLVQGNPEGLNMINGDLDPMFVNAPSHANAPFNGGDYRLQACSPAINVGNNDGLPIGITTDLDGHPRIFSNGIIDLGAYEYQLQKVSPIITQHPTSIQIEEYESALFNIVSPSATNFQWQVDTGSGFINISNANTSTYTVNFVTSNMNGYKYRCITTVCQENDTSDIASLTVESIVILPCIAPSDLNAVVNGHEVTFNWNVTGADIHTVIITNVDNNKYTRAFSPVNNSLTTNLPSGSYIWTISSLCDTKKLITRNASPWIKSTTFSVT